MNNNQRKKLEAKLHNLRRDERIAYEMHYAMYPESRPKKQLKQRRSGNSLLACYAMSVGLGVGCNL